MGFRTNRSTGKRFRTGSPSTSGKIVTKKNTQEDLKADLRKEREQLRRLQRQKVAEAKQKAKNRAIRESISRIRREQTILNQLNTNRISPTKVDEIRHGSRDHGGGNFRTIPGLVG